MRREDAHHARAHGVPRWVIKSWKLRIEHALVRTAVFQIPACSRLPRMRKVRARNRENPGNWMYYV